MPQSEEKSFHTVVFDHMTDFQVLGVPFYSVLNTLCFELTCVALEWQYERPEESSGNPATSARRDVDAFFMQNCSLVSRSRHASLLSFVFRLQRYFNFSSHNYHGTDRTPTTTHSIVNMSLPETPSSGRRGWSRRGIRTPSRRDSHNGLMIL
jgi:hypothetical protein